MIASQCYVLTKYVTNPKLTKIDAQSFDYVEVTSTCYVYKNLI